MSESIQSAAAPCWKSKVLPFAAGGLVVAAVFGGVAVRDMVAEFHASRQEVTAMRQEMDRMKVEVLTQRDRAKASSAPVAAQEAAVTSSPEKAATTEAALAASDQNLSTAGTLAWQLLQPGPVARPPIPLPSSSDDAAPRTRAKRAPAEPKVQPAESGAKTDVAEAGQFKLMDPAAARSDPQEHSRPNTGVQVTLLNE